ncbi:MAG: glycosyltransferase family 4 protein [Bacteroidia bacterium]|jgi:glycosyltransferase involved in cell wall biosynthesis|nr:glycosyltransferase family 4 protein [Bacteroidia bacterium]
MKSLNILVYCPVFLPEKSGYSHAFAQLISNLLQHQCKVDVVTPFLLNKGEKEIWSHPSLRIFRYKPQLNIWALGLFYQYGKIAGLINSLCKKYNYDLVLIETGDDPLLLASLSQHVLKKAVVRFHSTSDTEYLFIGKHKKYKIRKFFWKHIAANNVRRLSATNSYHLRFAHKHVMRFAVLKQAGVIINAVPDTVFDLPTSGGAKQFFMLGRMDDEGYRQKGYRVLIEALNQVAFLFVKHQATLIIVGSGKYFNEVKTALQPYSFVQLMEEMPHDQVMQTLTKSDVVLLPSLYEGLSMFALEAVSRGNVVIFGKTGGLIDLVEKNGFLVEPGSVDELAEAIRKVFEIADLKEMKQHGIELIKTYFNEEVQWQQINKFIS